MIIRLNRLLLYFFMLALFSACSTEEEVMNQPVSGEKELSFVACIGKTSSRTIYTEEQDASNNNRPYLKALWGGTQETKERILLYTNAGVYCGAWDATIKAGGESVAVFRGTLRQDDNVPAKAYYGKNTTTATALSETLDLTNQKQGASGSTAHISGQDFMIGEIKSLPNEGTDGSIEFRHLTGVLKYTLTFPEETEVSNLSDTEEETTSPLLVEMLSLKQASGEPTLQLQTSFNGEISKKYSSLDLTFKEDNGIVSVPTDNQTLVAYASFFTSQTQNIPFTVFARTTTGLYETTQFGMNQDLEAGKLYTLTANMNRLTQYDWYFNPEVLKDSNGKDSLVYKIGNADELEALAKIVNGDAGLKEADDFKDKTIEMTEDLDLKEKQPWTPIGDSQENAFSGKFNGGGNAISNMQCSGGGAQGLFGCLDGATILDLTVNGDVAGSGDYTGGIAGYAQNSSFENVSMNGNVSGEGDYTGGLVGYTEDCTIKNCEFGTPGCDFTITGLDWVGGLVGYSKYGSMWGCSNYGGVQGLYPNSPGGAGGGIVGGCEEGNIYISQNFGNVDNFLNAGGIAGSMNSGVVTGCTNYGGVSLSGMLGNLLYNIAGIVGNMEDTDINGCYSNGEIGRNGAGIAWGTGDVNGSYYEDGNAGSGGAYTDELTDEERDAMNDLLKDLGYGYNEEGVIEPLDKSNANVDNFGGGGKLE